jgi:hypothetical protein
MKQISRIFQENSSKKLLFILNLNKTPLYYIRLSNKFSTEVSNLLFRPKHYIFHLSQKCDVQI